MKVSLIYKIALAIMVIINAILIFILVQGPPHLRGPNDGNGRMIDRISLRLDLDDQQKKELFMMAKVHRDSMNKIDQEQRKLVKHYLSLLKVAQGQIERKDSLMNQIQSFEAAKIDFTYQHFEELKSICTVEQLVLFDDLVDEISGVLLGDKHNAPPPR